MPRRLGVLLVSMRLVVLQDHSVARRVAEIGGPEPSRDEAFPVRSLRGRKRTRGPFSVQAQLVRDNLSAKEAWITL